VTWGDVVELPATLLATTHVGRKNEFQVRLARAAGAHVLDDQRSGACMWRRGMAKLREVATTAELMKLLEESGILSAEQLRTAQATAAETNNCRLLARRLVAQDIVTRWQAGQLLVGWTRLCLGKYVLQSQIGRGDFGRLFVARHPQLDREVAIKTLSRRFTRYPKMVDQFLADARDVAALDHRNIVHVFDVDSCDDQFYMVMEHVRGINLRQQVEQAGPLDMRAVGDYLSQAADGLTHAHHRGVVHRDLRPGNLMVDDKGVVKIVGWGVGRLVGMRRTLDSAAAERADPRDSGYAAPELCEGREAGDARSDVYALGCIAGYLLTGQDPPANAVRGAHAAEPTANAAKCTELPADVPDDFAAIVRRMLAADPAERFPSAAELAQALQPWTRPGAETAPPPALPASTPPSESFDWTPEKRVVARTAKPPEATADAAGRSLLPLRRVPWWAVMAALAAAVTVIVGFAAVLVMRGSSQPEAAVDRHAPEHPEHVVSTPPRVRKRDDSRPPRMDVDPEPPMPEGSPPAATTPPEVDALPAEPAPATPESAPQAASEPAPLPDPNADDAPPPPADADADTQTPATTPPATTPPADEPLGNPWRDLPAAVDLPPVTDTADTAAPLEPLVLGSLAAPWTDACRVTLLGGQTAGTRRGTQFALTPTARGSGPSWQITLVDDKTPSAAPHNVARVWVDQDHLRFEWDAAAVELDSAGQLCNCVLRWTCDAQTHDLRLRTSQPAEPLRIDLKKQATVANTRVPASPDAKQVRFQVTLVEDPLPRYYTLSPTEPIAVGSDAKLQISLGPDAESQVLVLELMPELKTVFRLKCEAYFRVSPDASLEVLTTKRVAGAELQVAQNQELANQLAQQKRNAVINTASTDPLYKGRQEEMQKAAALLAECTRMTENMAALAEIRTAVAVGAAIHYRAFFLVDDCEVELLRTGPEAAPDQPETRQ